MLQPVSDSHYAGVWHLQESGTGTAGDYQDSTGNGNDSNNIYGEPTRTTGLFGYAQQFEGVRPARITLPYPATRPLSRTHSP